MIKKDSLIKGTLVLAAAALVARFLGLFQRIPFDYIFDAAGGAYFTLANNTYLLLLVIATGGIPSTISKMISERYAQGRIDEAQQIYRAALRFGIVAGIVMSCGLFFSAPLILDKLARNPGATLAVQAIAPALLLFPVIAMMRGYFQGRQMMTAGGISQIIEQILRVVTGVGLALIVVSLGYDQEWISAAATVGSVFGSIGAFGVMLWYAYKLKRQDAAEAAAGGRPMVDTKRAVRSPLKYKAIYQEIFKMSIPIVMTAMTVQLIYMIDSFFFNPLTASYYTPEAADHALKMLGIKAQAIAGIPPILAIALSTSIIPVISSAFATGNLQEVQRQGSLVMRIVLFTGIPAALSLTVAATSVTGSIYETAEGSAIVAALTAGTIFQITMMTSNSMLFGLGNARAPMIHTILGIVLKIIASIALGPILGVYGLIIASTLCFILITMLNLRTIGGVVKLQVLGSRWAAYLTVIVLTGAAGFGLDWGGRQLLQSWPDRLAYLATAAVTGMAMLGLYLLLLIVMRVVRESDVKSFPGPLRKVFGLLMRLVPAKARGASGG
ncbi:putative polysaccharide biosynthesis protein [Paenibacillus daejeonensis]|uniref:putative polysaccharide biosynthesis protein n=1 Tax=Paenibacillus daejeonensis TaxID=135193 RepID=UPI00037C3181|nr:polysaccharide biosynthesis protein [Paenibacillus daejeonensis]